MVKSKCNIVMVHYLHHTSSFCCFVLLCNNFDDSNRDIRYSGAKKLQVVFFTYSVKYNTRIILFFATSSFKHVIDYFRNINS